MSIVKRGIDRDSLILRAIVRFSSVKDEHEVRIRNLSAGGLMAEILTDAPRGERVEINHPSNICRQGRQSFRARGQRGKLTYFPAQSRLPARHASQPH